MMHARLKEALVTELIGICGRVIVPAQWLPPIADAYKNDFVRTDECSLALPLFRSLSLPLPLSVSLCLPVC